MLLGYDVGHEKQSERKMRRVQVRCGSMSLIEERVEDTEDNSGRPEHRRRWEDYCRGDPATLRLAPSRHCHPRRDIHKYIRADYLVAVISGTACMARSSHGETGLKGLYTWASINGLLRLRKSVTGNRAGRRLIAWLPALKWRGCITG